MKYTVLYIEKTIPLPDYVTFIDSYIYQVFTKYIYILFFSRALYFMRKASGELKTI